MGENFDISNKCRGNLKMPSRATHPHHKNLSPYQPGGIGELLLTHQPTSQTRIHKLAGAVTMPDGGRQTVSRPHLATVPGSSPGHWRRPRRGSVRLGAKTREDRRYRELLLLVILVLRGEPLLRPAAATSCPSVGGARRYRGGNPTQHAENPAISYQPRTGCSRGSSLVDKHAADTRFQLGARLMAVNVNRVLGCSSDNFVLLATDSQRAIGFAGHEPAIGNFAGHMTLTFDGHETSGRDAPSARTLSPAVPPP